MSHLSFTCGNYKRLDNLSAPYFPYIASAEENGPQGWFFKIDGIPIEIHDPVKDFVFIE